jgi:dihydrolipoamide dehydrogenase
MQRTRQRYVVHRAPLRRMTAGERHLPGEFMPRSLCRPPQQLQHGARIGAEPEATEVTSPAAVAQASAAPATRTKETNVVSAAAAAAPATDAASATKPVSAITAAAVANRARGSRLTHGRGGDSARPHSPARTSSGGAAPTAQAQLTDSSPAYHLERLSPLREAVARNMIASATAPIFHVTAQLSLQPLMDWAKASNLSFTVALARTCARAIVENPLFNASYTDEGPPISSRSTSALRSICRTG